MATNRDGYFVFRDLAAGYYTVRAKAAGYLPAGYLQNGPTDARVHLLYLKPDERQGALELRLWQLAALSGTVFDETGGPAVGARVRVLRSSYWAGRVQLVPVSVALTDDRGFYRVASLPPADYLVGIMTTLSTIPVSLAARYAAAAATSVDPGRAPPLMSELTNRGVASPSGIGFRIGDFILQTSGPSGFGHTPPQPAGDARVISYASTYFQNTERVAEATPVTLAPGEERSGVDLTLRLTSTVRVSGAIVGPDGPAADMGVRLLAPGTEAFARSDRGIEAATAVSDGNGVFTFLAVPPGTYTLKASRSDIIRVAPPSEGPAPNRMVWAEASVTVGATDLEGVTVLLKPGLRVKGRIEFAGSQSPPSPRGANVGLTSVATGQTERSSMSIVAADGTFVTNGDLPGRYYVNAVIPRGWTVRSITHATRSVADEVLELASEDLTDVVLTLTDKIARLSGTISDRNGGRDARANVVVFPADADGWRRGEYNPRRVRLVVGSSAGTYAVEGLPAGEYYVVAVDDDAASRWATPRFLDRVMSAVSRVTIAEGENKVVALTTSTVK